MNSRKTLILFLFMAFAALSVSAKTNKPDFYADKLPNLLGEQEIVLNHFHGKTILMSFFAPDCKWCHKQMKAFNRITESCSDSVQPLSAGINGNAIALRKELRRAKIKYPAFKVPQSMSAEIGEVPATPLTLVIGEGGELLGRFRGYYSFDQLAKIFPGCEG